MIDLLVVGAGFSGATAARLAAEAGASVLVIDRRSHVGGNAIDCHDDHGVLIHPYGPHIWHTNSERIHAFVSRFTDWRPYEHRVLANVGGQLVPFPINRTTINKLYGRSLDAEGVGRFLAEVRVCIPDPVNSEDVVLASVGRDLCDQLFRGYTRKQWGRDLSQLAASVVRRIPIRTDDEDRYFTDTYQGIPRQGYASLFAAMLDHPGIRLELERDFLSSPGLPSFRHLVYTGPLDAYYGYRFGRLPYRSIRFEHSHVADCDLRQPVAVINYSGPEPYTRSTEFKHLTGQRHRGTSLLREYPQDEGDPLYPVPAAESDELRRRYVVLADSESDVSFVGRLAQYRYLNMDQAVGAAIAAMDRVLGKLGKERHDY